MSKETRGYERGREEKRTNSIGSTRIQRRRREDQTNRSRKARSKAEERRKVEVCDLNFVVDV
jgi:hypothetical protein